MFSRYFWPKRIHKIDSSSGQLPAEQLPKKQNYPLTVVTVACPLIYCFVLISVRRYKRKIQVRISLTNYSRNLQKMF
jgi:hypothetical protein